MMSENNQSEVVQQRLVRCLRWAYVRLIWSILILIAYSLLAWLAYAPESWTWDTMNSRNELQHVILGISLTVVAEWIAAILKAKSNPPANTKDLRPDNLKLRICDQSEARVRSIRLFEPSVSPTSSQLLSPQLPSRSSSCLDT